MKQALKQQLSQTYQLAEIVYSIADQPLTIFSVANNYELLDQIDPEAFAEDERLPYWAEIWPASIALAEWILQTQPFKQARCLELGAGVGVVSVAAAMTGARLLTTDYFAEALEFAQLNAAANQVSIDTTLLDWRDITLTESFDFILAADVLYEQRNHQPILAAIDRLLAPQGKAYISDPQRVIAQAFLQQAQADHWTVETLPRSLLRDNHPLPIDIHILSH